MKMSVGVSVSKGALRNTSMRSSTYFKRWMSDEDCNVEDFISPLEEDQVNVIMTLHRVTNAQATLT